MIWLLTIAIGTDISLYLVSVGVIEATYLNKSSNYAIAFYQTFKLNYS